MSGYIKLYRGITDNPTWNKEPFSAGQAWIDLLLAANFKDKTVYIRKNKIEVKRGQLAWSMLTMSSRWKWSRGKVSRFLKDLENEHMVVQESGHLTTVLTICNYEKYQGFDTADSTADSTASDTADSTAGGTQHKNVKKEKNVKNTTGRSALDLSELPEGISEQSAKDFIEHRKAIKKPLTQKALNLCLATAAKAPVHGLTPTQVIDEAIMKGWMKPEPEWVAKSLARDSGNVMPFRQNQPQASSGSRKPFPGINHAPLPTGTGGGV